MGVDRGDAVAVARGGIGGGVVEGGQGEGLRVEPGRGGQRLEVGAEAFTVEDVAGEGRDEARLLGGLPDEVDGEDRVPRRWCEEGGCGEPDGRCGWIGGVKGDLDGCGGRTAELNGAAAELDDLAAGCGVAVGDVGKGSRIEKAGGRGGIGGSGELNDGGDRVSMCSGVGGGKVFALKRDVAAG